MTITAMRIRLSRAAIVLVLLGLLGGLAPALAGTEPVAQANGSCRVESWGGNGYSYFKLRVFSGSYHCVNGVRAVATCQSTTYWYVTWTAYGKKVFKHSDGYSNASCGSAGYVTSHYVQFF